MGECGHLVPALKHLAFLESLSSPKSAAKFSFIAQGKLTSLSPVHISAPTSSTNGTCCSRTHPPLTSRPCPLPPSNLPHPGRSLSTDRNLCQPHLLLTPLPALLCSTHWHPEARSQHQTLTVPTRPRPPRPPGPGASLPRQLQAQPLSLPRATVPATHSSLSNISSRFTVHGAISIRDTHF